MIRDSPTLVEIQDYRKVRRSALIVFCDPDDKEVIEAKQELYKNINGVWLENSDISHRKLSNNTVLYEKKPSFDVIKDQFEKIRYASEPSFGVFENMKKRNPNAKGGNPLTYKKCGFKIA